MRKSKKANFAFVRGFEISRRKFSSLVVTFLFFNLLEYSEWPILINLVSFGILGCFLRFIAHYFAAASLSAFCAFLLTILLLPLSAFCAFLLIILLLPLSAAACLHQTRLLRSAMAATVATAAATTTTPRTLAVTVRCLPSFESSSAPSPQSPHAPPQAMSTATGSWSLDTTCGKDRQDSTASALLLAAPPVGLKRAPRRSTRSVQLGVRFLP